MMLSIWTMRVNSLIFFEQKFKAILSFLVAMLTTVLTYDMKYSNV